jgi:hypothetical protein
MRDRIYGRYWDQVRRRGAVNVEVWKGRDMVATAVTVKWADAPAQHDYPAAASYLRLIAPAALAEELTALLEQAPTVQQRAKDILRAARLALLPADDPEVARDLKKIAKGQALSPILLVRGDLGHGRALQIADGYHRVCATYHVSEDTEIPCRLIDLPATAG